MREGELDALCSRAAEAGALVLRARGAELERTVAFGVARQLFGPVVTDEELFAGPAELARPVFELAEAPEADPYARVYGLYGLAVNLARRGSLVIAVDEMRWCDASSRRFVGYLGRRSDELPIVIGLAGETPRPEATGRDHAAEAALLAACGAPSREIAAHLLRTEPAGDRERVAVLYAAASEAAGLGDPAAAAELLRRAVAEAPPRAELLVELGEAERYAGDASATETLEAAAAAADEDALYARAVESLADVHVRSGRALRAAQVLEEALERLSGTPDAERLGLQLIGVGHVSRAARRHLEGRIRALELPDGAPATSAELTALAACAWAAVVDGGDAGLARELGTRVLGFTGVGDAAAISALVMSTVALMAAEDLATAGRVQENMVGAALRRGALEGFVALSSLLAMTRWRAGDITGSLDAAGPALELGAEVTGAGVLTHAGVAAALLAGLDAGRDPGELLGVLADATVRRDPDLLAWSQVLIAEAAVLAARGDHAAALERLGACDRADPGWGRDCPSLVPWRSGMALSLAATGAEAAAAELAAEEVALARRAGTSRALGCALRAHALVGPPGARREGLERALAVLESLHVPAVTARVRADLGAELRRDGDRAAAHELLSAAHAEALGCGALGIAGAAAAELRS